MNWGRNLLLAAGLLLVGGVAYAQESYATLTGHVSDSTGARVPGATIDIRNEATGAVKTIQSNGVGDYTVPFLLPGPYTVTVSMTGFKTFSHKKITLLTEETVTENVTLDTGSVEQTVTVEGGTPLVDTANATTGQTLTADQVEDLPSNGRSPLGFARFEFGAIAKGKHAASQTRPFDNSTADDFSLGGGPSASNEVLLDGVPNMQDSSRLAGFSPELDAVNAVRVDEFSANADMGDTNGGTVNITTKSGTNQFHGSASEYYSGSRPLEAKTYFTPAGTQAASTHFNQFGGVISGPVSIPHIFNGRDRVFFMYAHEGYVGNSPASVITSVPTQAERTGDFSQLLGNTKNPQLYNPYSGVYNSTTKLVTRSAIPGNSFANAGLSVSPVATDYLKYIPLPNYTGASTTADGENNYFANDPSTDNYRSDEGRLDVNITHQNRFTFEAHQSEYDKTQANIFNDLLSGTSAKVILWGGFAEDVTTFNPTTNLDARLSLTRSENTSLPTSAGTSPTTFGFPSYIADNSNSLAIPYMTFSDSASIPSLSAQPGGQAFFDTIQLFSAFTKTIGKHTVKMGVDLREYKNSTSSGSNVNGAYTFKSATGGPLTATSSAAGPGFGAALALFELGLPTSGTEAINPRFQYNSGYFAGFAQDDWKVMSNFTVSMGVRFENESSITESGNRAVTGFNPTLANAATAQAEANYANAPSPYLAAANFQPTGGLIYATSNHRYAYQTPSMYISPRIGFAYAPAFDHGKLSIRGGFGIYVNPFNDYNAPQSYGFSGTTSYLGNSTNQTNQVPVSNLSDPFDPSINPIQLPYGSYLGPNTNLGSSAIFFSKLHVPYTEKASLDVEKQIGRSWMVEVSAFSAHSVHLSSSLNVSAIPLLPYLVHSNFPNQAVTTALNAPVTNPFKGLFPAAVTPNGITVPNGTGLNTSSTISTAALLNAYPEYSSVTEQLVANQNGNFNALMFHVTKRMSYGLQFDANYEWSRNLGAQSTLNQGDTPQYGETTSDYPQHVTLTLMYQLPFGHGHAFANKSHWEDEAIGGWEVSTIYQALSGQPIQWGNVNYSGNFSDFQNHPHDASGTPSFNTAGFDTNPADQPNSYNYRTFPQYLLRGDANNNFDFSVLKNFTLGNRFILQPRIDAFNAFNHPQFNTANVSPTSSSFGKISGQLNSPRQLQGGVHIIF